MYGKIVDWHNGEDITNWFLRNNDNCYWVELGDTGDWFLHWRNSPMNYATIEDYVFKRNPLWVFTTACVWYDDVYMGKRVICTDPDLHDFYVVFNQHTVPMNDHISARLEGLHKRIFMERGFHIHS